MLDPAPRDADISRIMNPVNSRNFAQRAGQREKVLYWAQRGVPCTFQTASAAAEACNTFYGPDAATTYGVTIAPDQFETKRDLMWDENIDPDYLKAVENIVRLTP